MRLGQIQEAANSYRKAIELDPRGAAAYLGLGSAQRAQGRLQEAEATLRRATEIAPGFSLAHFELARTLQTRGCPAEADAFYRKALALDPGNHEIENDYAWMLATYHDPAVRDGRRALELARSACEATENANANYLDTLAAAYAEIGDFKQALNMTEAAVALLDRNDGLAVEIRARAESYRAGKPYRQLPAANFQAAP